MVNKKSRRAKVITVWGNSGAGKTTFSALLANYLTGKNKQILIISGDITVPVLPVLFPNAAVTKDRSLGTIFDGDRTDNGIVASKTVFPKGKSDVGVLAYAAGDNPYTYTDLTYPKASALFETASNMADFLILDCPSRVRDIFTATAIEYADTSVCMLSADLFGVSFYHANEPLLKDSRFHDCKEIFLAGNRMPYQPTDALKTVTNHEVMPFPHTKTIHAALNEGGIFTAATEKAHQKVFRTIMRKTAGDDNAGK